MTHGDLPEKAKSGSLLMAFTILMRTYQCAHCSLVPINMLFQTLVPGGIVTLPNHPHGSGSGSSAEIISVAS